MSLPLNRPPANKKKSVTWAIPPSLKPYSTEEIQRQLPKTQETYAIDRPHYTGSRNYITHPARLTLADMERIYAKEFERLEKLAQELRIGEEGRKDSVADAEGFYRQSGNGAMGGKGKGKAISYPDLSSSPSNSMIGFESTGDISQVTYPGPTTPPLSSSPMQMTGIDSPSYKKTVSYPNLGLVQQGDSQSSAIDLTGESGEVGYPKLPTITVEDTTVSQQGNGTWR